jgi:PAS domain S-box-containing protein
MIRWAARIAWALAVAVAPGHAAAGELSIGHDDEYALSAAFDYLEDKSAQLTLDDVLKPEVQAAFQPVSQRSRGGNFGFTHSAIWLRATLNVEPVSPQDWILEIAYPPLDRIQVYSPDATAAYQQQLGGDLQPFSKRAVPHRDHLFPLRLAAGAPTVIYLRLASEGTIVGTSTLWRPSALWRHDQAEYGVLSLYFGLLLGLMLYNLLLFVSVRDFGYLIYAGFAGSMAAAQAALTGLGTQFLWPQWTWWNSVLPAAGLSAAAILGLLFTRHFLSSAVRMPSLDRFLLAQLAGWAVSLVAAVSLPYAVSAWLITGLALLSVATTFVAGVISIRHEFAGARLFFMAWAVLLIGVVVQTAHDTGLLVSNVLTVNSLLIGSAIEMVLLSFALGDRINVARRFKELAQARIAAEHAMVGALSQAQERLRSDLQDREAILDRMRVGIELCVARRHEWVNARFAQMLGYAPEAMIGQSTRAIHCDEASWERFGRESHAALAATGSYVCEYPFKRADGEVLWVELSGTCLHPNDPDAGVIWTFLDLTGRRHSDFGGPLQISEPPRATDPVRPG